MDIELTEDQELLRNSVQRFLKDEYGFDDRAKIVAGEDGWSRAVWAKFADLGLLAAPFAEEYGGLGNGPLTTMIVMQEFGRSLVVEPYFETVVLAGGLIEALGTDDQRGELLAEIAAGEATWALAWAEPGSRYNLNKVSVSADRSGDDYVLSGTKAAVIGAPWADRLIVSARTSGRDGDRDGVSLFIVDSRAAGLHMQSYRTVDGRRAAEVTLKDVRIPAVNLLGREGQGSSRSRAVATAASADCVPRL
ncbi:acyl-CoA dehydrogenase family protein [Tardiphaga robiniae]|uniref:acyl-CoA dehydrogenase family protein n=1 Tax=Tardiphaga robiniae TaxID=943830 RepID=UPI0030843FB5